MIMQKPKPDLETLLTLAEKKSPYLVLSRTPEAWSITDGNDSAPATYESLTDALMNFILGDANNDNEQP